MLRCHHDGMKDSTRAKIKIRAAFFNGVAIAAFVIGGVGSILAVVSGERPVSIGVAAGRLCA